MNNEKYANIDAAKQKDVIKGIIDILWGEKDDSHYELADFLIAASCNCEQDIKDLQKVLAELNPNNNSEFENQLPAIVDDADIFQGTIDLGNLSTSAKDSEGTGDLTDTHNSNKETTKKSGIDYVQSRIEHYLIKLGLAKNVMVEYSLLSSTLEPTNPDKLQCISFMEGDDDFIDNIGKYYKACIDQTEIDQKISIYQHPRFLYDIDFASTQKQFVDTSDAWADRYGVTGTFKTSGSKGKTLTSIKASGSSIYKKVGDVYMAAFELERSFNDMLLNAKEIAKEIETDPQSKKLVDIQDTLHSYCHKNISSCRGKDSVYVAFPIYGSRASNQLSKYEIIRSDKKVALQGIGAFFIYFEPLIDLSRPIYQQFIKTVMGKIAYEMGNFIRLISANYMFNLGLQLQEKARKEAVKSAKAAIMSRNMSHNLGSHVMSYLKQHLGSVKDMLNDRIFSLLFESEDDMLHKLSQEVKEKIENSDKVALPFLVGMGQFISYLQERQDFIATIATDFVPYYANVNFKDFIYDELNPDKRYERHKDRANLKIDNILLGNIARSEGLGRPTSPTSNTNGKSDLSDIVLMFRNFDGNPVEGSDINGKLINEKDPAIIEKATSLKEMRAYDMSLPGGVVGRQAVFSIVENVIRNAAKHGNWREQQKLELSFDIFTKEDINGKSDRIPIDDNCGEGHLSLFEVFDSFYKDASDMDDLYIVTLTDNLVCDQEKLAKLRMAISELYVDERGVMKEANKGIKEMRISASWLRSIKIEDEINCNIRIPKIENKQKSEDENKFEACKYDKNWRTIPNKAPILYARLTSSNKNGKGNLQYIFCLMRPKKVAVISSRFANCASFNRARYKSCSWGLFSPEEYIGVSNKSYEFILLDDNRDGKRYDEIRRCTSSRLFRLSEVFNWGRGLFCDEETFFSDLFNGEIDCDAFLIKLYKFLSNCNPNDLIAIHDEKSWGELSREKGLQESEITSGIVTICKSGGVVRPYLYRTHYETEENFNYVINMMNNSGAYSQNLFIEGITGNNSTDRLVRNEEINDLWSYRHLHSMKENIAIFDERIFSKVYGKEERDFYQSDVFRLDKLKAKCINYFDDALRKQELSDDDYKEIIGIINEEILSVEELRGFIKEEGLSEETINRIFDSAIISNSFTGTAYAQKGINIFNLIKSDKEDKKFYLCGLKWNDESDIVSTLYRKREINEKGDFVYKSYSKCEVLATISWNSDDINSPLVVERCGETPIGLFTNRYDRISIHQGLLDKLYDEFEIKGKPNEKERLTKCFFEKFARLETICDIIEFRDSNNLKEFNQWFLPGMCIHSGRSKPNTNDMPQHLPFIQYSSVEHAVMDCKYSLVELLDYARYES